MAQLTSTKKLLNTLILHLLAGTIGRFVKRPNYALVARLLSIGKNRITDIV